MKANEIVVSLEDGIGLKIRDEAGRIVEAFGNDPTVTLNALVFVLGLVVRNIRSEVRNDVIDGIPENIRANMGVVGGIQ